MSSSPQVAVATPSVAPLQPTSSTGTHIAARELIVRLFREKPLGAAGGVVCVLFLLCGIFSDVLAPYSYSQIAPLERLRPPSWHTSSAPTTWDAICCRAVCMARGCR